MIVDILDMTMDFSKINRVGPIEGNPTWRRYTVYFSGGDAIDIYEDRYRECFPRAEFVKLWRELNSKEK